MNYFSKLYTRWQHFLHNEMLKQKVYSIVFESDTPKGRLFDIILISSIIVSVLMVILESIHLFSPTAYWVLRLLEYLLTLFFTIEYLARIYCLTNPRKYIFSFFGLVDLLATLPVYLSFFLKGAHYLLVIRAFRLIRIFRIFKLFSFISEGNLLLRSLRISAPKISVFFFFVLILVTSMGTVMYMIEGDVPGSEFNNIPNSIYWAIVTMTTVGYGDHSRYSGRTISVGHHHAHRLHHHCRTYRNRIGGHGKPAEKAGRTPVPTLPPDRSRCRSRLLQILRKGTRE